MSTLAGCLKKAGKAFTAKERQLIEKIYDELGDTFAPRDRANIAIEEFAETKILEFRDIVGNQITEQDGPLVRADEIINVSALEKLIDAKDKIVKAEEKAAVEAQKKADEEARAKEDAEEKKAKKEGKVLETDAKKRRESRMARAIKFSMKFMRTAFGVTDADPDMTDARVLSMAGLADAADVAVWHSEHKDDPLPADIIPEATDIFNDPNLTSKEAYIKVLELLEPDSDLRLIGERIVDHIPDDLEIFVVEDGDAIPRYYREIMNTSHGWTAKGFLFEGGPLAVFGGLSTGAATGLTPQTIVHELLHIATQDIISGITRAKQLGKKELAKWPKSAVEAHDELIRLQKLVMLGDTSVLTQLDLSKAQIMQMTDLNEFVTYVLTKPSVAARMKTLFLPSENRTAWSKFVEATSKLLGFNKKDEVTAFEAVLHATDQLLEADFRRDEALAEELFMNSPGVWYQDKDKRQPEEPPPTPETTEETTEKKPKKQKVKKLTKEQVPVRAISYTSSDDMGTETHGLQLAADDFVGDTVIQRETGDQITVQSKGKSLGAALLKIFNEDNAAGAALYHAISEAVRFKAETQDPALAKRLALQIFQEVYYVGDDAVSRELNARYVGFINNYNFADSRIVVGRGATDIDFYRDGSMLEMINPETMTDKELRQYQRNPALFIDPVIVAKLKVSMPELYAAYTDFVYSTTNDPDTGAVDRTAKWNLYDFVVSELGSTEKASKALNKAGIKGMVKSDQSRFVLFDEKQINAIVDNKKPRRPDNRISSDYALGEVTPRVKQVHVKMSSAIAAMTNAIAALPAFGITKTEIQTLTKIANVFQASVRPFITKKDSSKSFASAIDKLVKDLENVEALSNQTYSEVKAELDADVFKEASRILVKDSLMTLVVSTETYSPLQRRIASILLAATAGDYQLASDRAKWLSEDMQDGDVAAIMMQVALNGSGKPIASSAAEGLLGDMILQNRLVEKVPGATPVEQLQLDIPNAERTLGKTVTGASPILMENGQQFIDQDLDNAGQGLDDNGIDETQFNEIWDGAKGQSRDEVIEKVDTLGIDGPVRPKDYEFWNRALKLPDQARYWYEVSTEAMIQMLPNLSAKDMKRFFAVVAATSPNTNPIMNMQRAVSLMGYDLAMLPAITATMTKAGNPMAGAIAKALAGGMSFTNKIHNFGGTFMYIAGFTDQAPLSTNDRQVASSFNMHWDTLFDNQELYFTISRFYLDLAKALNKNLPEGAEPYQAWQLQALGWVQERIDSPRGSDSNDDYMQALEEIKDAAVEAGIIKKGEQLTTEALTDPRLQRILDPTTQAWAVAKKTTVEMWSERSPDTSEYIELKKSLGDTVDFDKHDEQIAAIMKRAARALTENYSVPDPKPGNPKNRKKFMSPVTELLSTLVGKRQIISRVDFGEGTYAGNANMNVRVPLITQDHTHIQRFVAVLNEGFNQWVSPATYNKLLNKGEKANGIETVQVFIPHQYQVDVQAISDKLPNDWELSVSYAENGTVIDVVPDFMDGDKPFGMTKEEADAFFTNVLPGDYKFEITPSDFQSVASMMTTEYATEQQKTDAANAEKVALKELRDTVSDVKSPALKRFLKGSDVLLVNNKNNDTILNNLVNIRNAYNDKLAKVTTSKQQLNGAFEGFLQNAIDQTLKVVPNEQVSTIRQYLKAEAGAKGPWSSSVRERIDKIRARYQTRVNDFNGQIQAINEIHAQKEAELAALNAEIKHKHQDALDLIAPQQNMHNDGDIVELDPGDTTTAHTSSFKQEAPTAELNFEIQQLQMQLQLETQSREDRLDIGAGRREKDIQNQLDMLRRQRNSIAEEDPRNQDGTTSIDDVVDALVERTSPQMSIRQRFSRWVTEHSNGEYLRDTMTRWYQYWVSDIAAIERLEREWVKHLEKTGKRLEGNESPTALTFQAKNAAVSASIPIHRTGVKLVDGQIVPDERQKGLEKILDPVAALGNKYIRIWEAYLVVKRAERLMAEGKENFVLDEQIQAVKDYVEARPALHELFERTQEEYAALNKQVLEVAIAAGYINREDAFGGFWGEIIDPATGKAIHTIKGPKNTVFADEQMVASQLEQYMLDNDLTAGEVRVHERTGWYHDDYVPFNRVNEAKGTTQEPGQGGGILQVRKGVVKLTGGVGRISVIENMSKNITFMMSGAMKTVAMAKVVEMTSDVATEKIEMRGEAPMIDADQAKSLAQEMGVDIDSMDIADRQRWLRMLSRATPFDPDAVVLYQNGRATHYRVTDPLLLDAMKQVGVKETVSWLHKLGFITRILTKSITIMPGFLVRNFTRESQNTFVIDENNSANPFKHMLSAVKHVWSLARDPAKDLAALQAAQDAYKESPSTENKLKVDAAQAKYDRKTSAMFAMMAAGNVSYNNYFDVTPDEIRKRLMKVQNERNQGWMRRIIGSPMKAGKFYMRLAIASEHANRLTVRDNYINKRSKELEKELGRPPNAEEMSTIRAEAGFRAQDVLNFSRRGAGLGADIAIAVLPFINPRIQGMDRLLRGAKYDKKNFALKMGMMTSAAIAMAMYNWEENEEEMDELKETDKDLFYHFWIPINGKKEHWRIPKGFEIGQVAGTIPERIVERWYSDRPEPAEKVAKRFMQLTFGIQPPQPVKPIMEVAMNYDTFRQRPILNFGMQFKPAHMQYDAYTNYVVKDLAQSMPEFMPDSMKSPKYLQHLLNGYFGPIGATILESGNELYRRTGNAPDAPAKEVSQYYGIRDYYRSNVEYTSRSLDYFYEMLTTANKSAAELKTMREEGDPRYKDEREKRRELTKSRKALNRISKRLGTYSKRMKAIYSDPDMDPTVKFQELQSLQKQRNEVTRKAMERYWNVFY